MLEGIPQHVNFVNLFGSEKIKGIPPQMNDVLKKADDRLLLTDCGYDDYKALANQVLSGLFKAKNILSEILT